MNLFLRDIFFSEMKTNSIIVSRIDRLTAEEVAVSSFQVFTLTFLTLRMRVQFARRPIEGAI